MNEDCGCCEGTEKLTPLPTANRPGLDALTYRVGTHATFLETMKAGLADFKLEVPRGEVGAQSIARINPLSKLATRDSDDPAIALLDAWATVGDVLTFYQERIANEGYLRTATERRSILELAQLIDYSLRPGVASSVFLALTMEKGHSIKLKPGDIKAQSVPGPGELPQTFENSEELDARAQWNTLGPRLARPQTRTSIETIPDDDNFLHLYLKGIATNLAKNDPLLIDFNDGNPMEPGADQPSRVVLFCVMDVVTDTTADRTLVKLEYWNKGAVPGGIRTLQAMIASLKAEASALPGRTSVERALELLNGLNARIDQGANAVDLTTIVGEIVGELESLRERLPATATVAGPLLEKMSSELAGAADHLMTNSSFKRSLQTSFVNPDHGDELKNVLTGLVKTGSIPPKNALRFSQDIRSNFARRADTGLQLAGAFKPEIRQPLQAAVKNIVVTNQNQIQVYALRTKAAVFGQNAPLKTTLVDTEDDSGNKRVEFSEWTNDDVLAAEFKVNERRSTTIYLNGNYDKILPRSWVVVDRSAIQIDPANPPPISIPEPGTPLLIARTMAPKANLSRAVYGISGPTTQLDLVDPDDPGTPGPWLLTTSSQTGLAFPIIRRTVVYAQSEELALADAPIAEPICDGAGENSEIELDDLYSELKAGRWLVVAGERADIKVDDRAAALPGNVVEGVRASELVMLASVRQDVATTDGGLLEGDKNHTFIKLAKRLEYCYRRDKVVIYANVLKATHGETRNEALGAGDTTKPFQSFTLRQPPLTYVASQTPAGAESTLKVYVNDVQWFETDSLADLDPGDRKFVTRTDDESKTTVVFGNGERGARLPTGLENVRAVYRNGIGKPGNVAAEQISQLMARPLGVKDVINPLRASGGADKEDRDQARKNAPLTVTALDRLVSTEDYADFARTFAGIGKSISARFSDGRRELVHVTIAGAGDIPIDENSDLFRNLSQALRKFGDPFQPLKVEVRELMFLVLSASIHIQSDYVWEPVVTNVRARLLDRFSYERRDLGQDALVSEVISVIQSVRGVTYVDVDVFGGVAEKIVDGNTRRLQTPQEILSAIRALQTPAPRVPVNLAEFEDGVIHPAQLAYLTPEVPATLVLNQI